MFNTITNIFLKIDADKPINARHIRGFFGNEFKEYNILHNHYNDKYLFNYPKVQYKVIDGVIIILGINEGGDILKKISSEMTYIYLDKKYEIVEKIIQEKKYDIKPCSKEKHYKFLTPWLGLNSKNYNEYKYLKDWKSKKIILNKILVGNVLSLSKNLGIMVDKKLYVKSKLNEEIVEYKSIKMNAFVGEFTINYNLPNYIGIGKGVSQGFGSIIKIND